jgi:hypothetical protein
MGAFSLDPKGRVAQGAIQNVQRTFGDRLLPGGDIFENSPRGKAAKAQSPAKVQASSAPKPESEPRDSSGTPKSNLGGASARKGGGSGASVTGLRKISINKKTLLGE